MTRLSQIFPSRKNPHHLSSKSPTPSSINKVSSTEIPSPSKTTKKKTTTASQWSVYLIISTRLPKTYVGVTTNFSRRLKQHNGEIKGGAKSSSAGRPWTLACIIQGFRDQSEACEFEYKWKSISRKMSRKKGKEDQVSNALLEHREAALSKVKESLICSHLWIDWHKSGSP